MNKQRWERQCRQGLCSVLPNHLVETKFRRHSRHTITVNQSELHKFFVLFLLYNTQLDVTPARVGLSSLPFDATSAIQTASVYINKNAEIHKILYVQCT